MAGDYPPGVLLFSAVHIDAQAAAAAELAGDIRHSKADTCGLQRLARFDDADGGMK